MPLTKSVVVRADEVGGKNIRAFLDGTNHYLQGVALVDENGDHQGVGGNPVQVQQGSYIHAGKQKQSALSQQLVETPRRILGASFHEWFSNRRVSLTIHGYGSNAAGYEKQARAGYNSGAASEGFYAEIDPGTQKGQVDVGACFEAPYVQGVGYFLEGTFRVGHGVGGLTGHALYFGFGDFVNGVFFAFKADGTVAIQTYMNSALVLDHHGTDWTTPVVQPGLYDANIHRWGLQCDPLSQTMQVWQDGIMVWSYDAPDDDILLPLMTSLRPRFLFAARNTATLGASIKHHLYHIGVTMEGAEPVLQGLTRYRANGLLTSVAPLTAEQPLLVLTHSAFQIHNGYKYSYRAVRIRRVGYRTNKNPANIGCFIWRGKNITAYGAKVPVHAPNDATTFTGVATALVAATSGAVATGTGFVGGDTVQYKITALGSVGETASYATSNAFVVIAGPTMSVLLTMATGLSIPHALAYNIYRSVNAGTYQWIATIDATTFGRNGGWVDDAYRSNTSVVPPVTGAAFGDSYCYANAGFGTTLTATSGTLEDAEQLGNDYSRDVHFADGEFILLPGECMVLACENAHAVDTAIVSADIEWDENP